MYLFKAMLHSLFGIYFYFFLFGFITIKSFDRHSPKKLVSRIRQLHNRLNRQKGVCCGIPENNIEHFYRLVHEYSTSSRYSMNCFMLFEIDFSDYHMISLLQHCGNCKVSLFETEGRFLKK